MDILKTAIVVLLCALVVDYQGVWADVYRYVMWGMAIIAVVRSGALLSLYYVGRITGETRKALHAAGDTLTHICAGALLAAHTTTMTTIGAKWLTVCYVITFVFSWVVWLVLTRNVAEE